MKWDRHRKSDIPIEEMRNAFANCFCEIDEDKNEILYDRDRHSYVLVGTVDWLFVQI